MVLVKSRQDTFYPLLLQLKTLCGSFSPKVDMVEIDPCVREDKHAGLKPQKLVL